MELKRLYDIKRDLKCKKLILEELKESLDGLKALRTQEKVQGGLVTTDDVIISKLDRIESLEKEVSRLYLLQFDIENIISQIKDNREREVLSYRYITDMTWEQIAEETNYSVTHVRRIHDRATKRLKKAEMCLNV